MPLTISDEVLREAGIDESEALAEFACHLFDAGKLSLWSAAKLARLDRLQFEDALRRRKLPIYRPTVEDLEDDLRAIARLGI